MTHKIKKYTTFLLSLLFLSACTEDIMDDINKNENNPSEADAKVIMTDIMTATAFSTVGGTVSFYPSIYVEHEAGVQQQAYNAENRLESTAASTNNNDYNSIYENIRNIKSVIKKTSEGGNEAFNPVTLGVAKIFLAYNAAVLTDVFGDVPYSEAAEYDEKGQPKFLQPRIDKQEDIYKDIMKNLDEAIELLKKEDRYGMGGQDLIYGGNAEKWNKTAYGLKARYLMRTLLRSTDKNKVLNDIITNVDSSFKSYENQFMFNHYNGSSVVNPLFAISVGSRRHLLGASLSFIEKLEERNDPRLFKMYNDFYTKKENDLTDVAELKSKAFKNGNGEMQAYVYPISYSNLARTMPTFMLSYHELLFLRAEALARLNDNANAEVALKNAIVASFNTFVKCINNGKKSLKGKTPIKIESSDIDTYFTNSVKPLFDANPIKEIMVQKYIAFNGASGEAVEAYNDCRRLKGMGENFIELKNPLNSDKFPYRLPYGNSGTTANRNIQLAFGDGSYVFKEPVWWAGGSR